MKRQRRSCQEALRRRMARIRLACEQCEPRLMLAGDMQQVFAADTGVLPGTQLNLAVRYQTLDSGGTPSNQLASGLGLRMHFNSTSLTFDSLSLGVTEDAFFNPSTIVVQDDTSDLDNDPTTDKFITSVWNDVLQADGGWPWTLTQPVTLYTATFTAAANFSGQTGVNFTSSSTGTNPSNGQSFDFASQSATITAESLGTLDLATTDANKSEGISGTTDFTFTVTRSNSTFGPASVDYAVSGTGANPADATDFGGTLPSGTVDFADGESSKVITIEVSGDTDIEFNEDFTVTISNPTNATLGNATATGTIQNDDFNTPPTITAIDDLAISEDGSTGDLAFTIGDLETPVGDLIVSATSDNQTLVPDGSIVLGGSGTDRTISFSPVGDQFGTAEITITVSDGDEITTEKFVVTVNSVNDPPTITAINDQLILIDTATKSLPFTIGDIDHDIASLSLGATSDNQSLIPDGNIVLGGSGASRNITVTPVAGQTGIATISVSVGDGLETVFETFVVEVTADGLDFHYLFDIPGVGTVTPGGNLLLPQNTQVTVSVVAEMTPTTDDLISYQLNFLNSDLGTGKLTLSDWATDFPLSIDGTLSTPTDTFVAAAHQEVQTTPVVLGTFVLTTPTYTQGGPSEFLLTMNKLTGDEVTDTTVGSLGGQSYLIRDFGDVLIQFDVTPPQVTNVQANVSLTDPADLSSGVQPSSWSTQRSDIRNIVVTFDEDISDVLASDLVLTNLGVDAPVDTDQDIALTDGMLSVAGNTLTITFAAGQLPDGVYQLQVLPTVTDIWGNSLDGDGSGEGGDSFTISGNLTNKLFKLTGDYNGTGGVNVQDSAVPVYWFGTILPDAPEYVDLNQSGAINVLDFSGYVANFETSLVFPSAQQSEVFGSSSSTEPALSALVDFIQGPIEPGSLVQGDGDWEPSESIHGEDESYSCLPLEPLRLLTTDLEPDWLSDSLPEEATNPEPALFPLSETFTLHSNPGSNFTIYLDFDGHTTVGTTWNTQYNITTIVSPPYNISGSSSTFSDSELRRIQEVWEIVAEDFAPFDVNVTTEDPGTEALRKSGSGDTQWGARVVITDDTFADCGCGGHAYAGAFEDSQDEPTFVYNSSLLGVAEAVSHEVGHMLNLSHDGQTGGPSYYEGHGSGATEWGPLMGASYYVAVSQWDSGEYYNANNDTSSANYGNGKDDLQVITTTNGFGYRVDDHGNGFATATALNTGGETTFTESGIIERNTDLDVFSFTTSGGVGSFQFTSPTFRPNLDIWAGIYDSSGTLISQANPSSSLSASLNNIELPAGTYYLKVDGVGSHGVYNPVTDTVEDPASPPWETSSPVGYSQYGSLGQYVLTGTLIENSVTSLSVADVSVSEGDLVGIVISLSEPTTDVVEVTIKAVPGTASQSDFAAVNQVISIPANSTSFLFEFATTEDSDVEGPETFTIELSNPVNAEIGDGSATVTILDNDTAVSITALDAVKAEGNSGTTDFTFTISRTGDTTGSTAFDVEVLGSGSNPADASDFEGGFPNGRISFSPDQTSGVLTITVNGDVDVEADEGFKVVLSNPSANAVIVASEAEGTILNDDAIPIAPLDVNADGIVDASTDGNLIMSVLLGLPQADLARFQGSTTQTLQEITDNVSALVSGTVLDVDESGTTDSTTDGNLILSVLFGLPSESLTSYRGDTLLTNAQIYANVIALTEIPQSLLAESSALALMEGEDTPVAPVPVQVAKQYTLVDSPLLAEAHFGISTQGLAEESVAVRLLESAPSAEDTLLLSSNRQLFEHWEDLAWDFELDESDLDEILLDLHDLCETEAMLVWEEG